MIQTTGAEIRINGARISTLRDGYFSTDTVSEDLLNQSLADVPIYGRDLMMFAEGDLFVEEREKYTSKDLADLGGLLNYAQAITHRLMTTRGYHPGDAFFGVPWNSYIGQTYAGTSALTNKLTADITEELLKDHRTREVLSVRAEFINLDAINVTVNVSPVHRSSVAVEIALNLEALT